MGTSVPMAHGVAGESAAIVEAERVGLCFESENTHVLCEAIRMIRKP